MCARFKFTVPEQFTKGNLSLFGNNTQEVEAHPGSHIPIVTQTGKTRMGIWNGFARIETLKQVWLDKGWTPVKITNVSTFKERDTVGGSKELVEFQIKKNQGIGAIAKVFKMRNSKPYIEVKVITQRAEGKIKDVHHRMPKLIG